MKGAKRVESWKKIAVGIGAGVVVLGASAAAIVALLLMDDEPEGEETEPDDIVDELDQITQLGVPTRGEGFKR